MFGKAVALGHAFGRTATALHAEYQRRRSYNSVYEKIYVKIVGRVLMNRARYVSLGCTTKTYNLYQSSRISLLNFKASIFIYAGWLRAYIKVSKSNHASHIWNQLRTNEKFT